MTPEFFHKIDAQPTMCPTATLLAAGDNHPLFPEVPFGVTGGSANKTFNEFENDICPKWCPVIPECDPAIYTMLCDTALDGNFNDPSALISYNISDTGTAY